jgi:uncharacterized membrane protein (GlpM family)
MDMVVEMISDSLGLHLALAFVVGCLWVILVTVVSEKKGSALGGILAGLPSTSALSFLFIGINQSPAAAVQATTVFPLVFSFTCAFLLFYAVFAKKGFVVGLSISLLMWLTVSGVVVVSGVKDFRLSLVCGILVSVATLYVFVKKLRLKSFRGEGKNYGAVAILERGIGAGSLVFLAVLLSQIGGSVLGGIASAFPAVFTSTLIILNKTKGTEYSRSMTEPMVVSAILTCIPYSIAVRYSYPSLGTWLGTIIAYAFAAPFAVLSHLIMSRRSNKNIR